MQDLSRQNGDFRENHGESGMDSGIEPSRKKGLDIDLSIKHSALVR